MSLIKDINIYLYINIKSSWYPLINFQQSGVIISDIL